jgi:DNA repair protein RadD
VEARASSNAILSTQQKAEWVDVDAVLYRRHEKPGKPASMRVIYDVGFLTYSEWVCFEHTGYARQKAEAWWKRRHADIPVPKTVEDALKMTEYLREPVAIQVRPVGQYTEITAVRFA